MDDYIWDTISTIMCVDCQSLVPVAFAIISRRDGVLIALARCGHCFETMGDTRSLQGTISLPPQSFLFAMQHQLPMLGR